MAEIGQDPVLPTPASALAALERDLPVVLEGRTLEQAGWLRPEPLTLVLPLLADTPPRDFYFLRLNFAYYSEWPPSARFVNPYTLEYQIGSDRHWLPKIEGTPEIQVHENYGSVGQLICCSATLEFYQIRHDVKAENVWNPKTDPDAHNFAFTINAVKRALLSAFYKGRQG